MKKYEIGTIVTGKVTGIENYGIFLSLDDSTVGLIHISEISESFVRNVSDYVEIGEQINALVIGDNDDNHLKLSIKNIDYRIQKKNYHLIKETPSGFETLNASLYNWISYKLKDIKNKE